MKTVLFILLCMSLSVFEARATDDNPQDDPLFDPTGLPLTTISGVEVLDPEYFGKIYNSFLDPIYRSDFCMVIARIVIDTSSREAGQWTADVYLKTGEHIALHKFESFYDASAETTHPFARGLKSVFHQMEGFRRTDPKLKKFFHEAFPHHHTA